ncbi:hypothetical protein PSTU1396_06890 [Providencia stuartii]|uniref:Uncharacterized protein n=1 Tax=Providencia stuartii ATCC 25827 TaxID=471874 RepID=A0AA86YLU3_PROST|nr:hypothetical protein DR96_50 [Providencia stuartii]EDU60325.1 hypothetical protein PROSTU_03531 [Providencia stuartii ATCC 25827]SST03255.1 Uncharacterised protein [Acinetobacter baumannii]CAK6608900.1 hypothetical protein PSTU1396_06890 [Providencia stuartii]CAK6610922.1 hypothetical protein PS9952019_06880 [Providencia stuartii]
MPTVDITDLLGYSIINTINMIFNPLEYFCQENMIESMGTLLLSFMI